MMKANRINKGYFVVKELWNKALNIHNLNGTLYELKLNAETIWNAHAYIERAYSLMITKKVRKIKSIFKIFFWKSTTAFTSPCSPVQIYRKTPV